MADDLADRIENFKQDVLLDCFELPALTVKDAEAIIDTIWAAITTHRGLELVREQVASYPIETDGSKS